MRLKRNSEWTDDQIERRILRQVDDLYDTMSHKWQNTSAATDEERVADMVEDSSPKDCYDTIVYTKVLEKYHKERDLPSRNTPIIAKDDAEKYQKLVGQGIVNSHLSQIRRDEEKYGYLAPVCGVVEDPQMGGGQRNITINLRKYRGVLSPAQLEIFEQYQSNNEEYVATRKLTLRMVKQNLEKTDAERLQAKKDEIKRRRNRVRLIEVQNE